MLELGLGLGWRGKLLLKGRSWRSWSFYRCWVMMWGGRGKIVLGGRIRGGRIEESGLIGRSMRGWSSCCRTSRNNVWRTLCSYSNHSSSLNLNLNSNSNNNDHHRLHSLITQSTLPSIAMKTYQAHIYLQKSDMKSSVVIG